jgi:leucyl aminopeptidase (aminopeptidase T)
MRAGRAPPAEAALAAAVLDRYLAVRRGGAVTVETWSHALHWARALVVEARRRGVHPTLVVEDETAFFRTIEVAGSPAVLHAPRAPTGTDAAYVYLGGPEEFPRLLGLPAADLEAVTTRHDADWWAAARQNRTRAVRLAVADATEPAAIRYGVDREAWEAELVRASLVDPERLERLARRITGGLRRARRLRVRHPNGTELQLRLATTSPIVISGRAGSGSGLVWGQVPTGLLVLPLRPGSTDGTWESNRPVYDRFVQPPLGVGGRFEFQRGRLQEFAFERGGEMFAATYARAGRGRDQPVALTIGLNPEISHAPEVLEFGAGTLGLLIGDNPYLPSGGTGGFSFLAPLAEGDVDADDRPWLTRGLPPVSGRRGGGDGRRARTRTGRRTRRGTSPRGRGGGPRSAPR